MSEPFRVSQIDHVELFVPDRYQAAGWYRQVFGMEIVPEYEDWAATSGGPLMVSSDGGKTMLALFEGEPPGFRTGSAFHRVAFRVDGPAFMRFRERVAKIPIYDEAGNSGGQPRLVDHDKAYSIYFCDPYGYRFEVTSYDHEAISARLALA